MLRMLLQEYKGYGCDDYRFGGISGGDYIDEVKITIILKQ